jgi:hypothetical protein
MSRRYSLDAREPSKGLERPRWIPSGYAGAQNEQVVR